MMLAILTWYGKSRHFFKNGLNEVINRIVAQAVIVVTTAAVKEITL
jgi:hypothetical protein